MKITFVTEELQGGWLPSDLDAFLGGNQECLTLLTRELVRRKHEVEIFTNLRAPTQSVDDRGVVYKLLTAFDPEAAYDVLVSMKTKLPWLQRVQANRKIHWSLDVEQAWPGSLLAQLDVFTNLGTYHRGRMPWLQDEKTKFAPLALPEEYNQLPDMSKKKPGSWLYATSPDRGLETLLEDWPLIWSRDQRRELLISYNWNRLPPQYAQGLQARVASLPKATMALFPSREMRNIFLQAERYVLPLNRNDSDLYGFGALKAQACGCTIVLNRIQGTGFEDSIRSWERYADWVGPSEINVITDGVNPDVKTLPRSWSQAAETWEEIFHG